MAAAQVPDPPSLARLLSETHGPLNKLALDPSARSHKSPEPRASRGPDRAGRATLRGSQGPSRAGVREVRRRNVVMTLSIPWRTSIYPWP